MLMARHNHQQAVFARRIGISRSALSEKLHGRRKWMLDDLDAISAAYGIDPRALLSPAWAPAELPGGPNNVTNSAMSFRHLGRRRRRVPGGLRPLPVAA